MKRFLSLILTLALVLSLVPVAFAESEAPKEQLYKFIASDDFPAGRIIAKDVAEDNKYEPYKNEINGVQYFVRSDILDYTEDRNWKLYDVSETLVEVAGTTSNAGWFSVTNSCLKIECAYLNHRGDFALSLRGEQTGFYIPHMSAKSTNANQNIGVCLFFENDSISNYETYRGDSENSFVYTLKIPEAVTQFDGTKVVYTEKGDDLLAVFTTTNSRRPTFYDIKLTEVRNPQIAITANKTELDITDNTIAEITSATVTGDNQETAMPIGSDFVKYKSSNETVVKVDANGTITAVGGGTAKIYAQSPDGLVKSNEITVTVSAPSVPEEDEALTDAFKVTEEAAKDYVAPTVAGLTSDGAIAPVDNKDGTFTLTAPETKGDAKFLYWAKGMTANKRIISFSNVIENYVPEEVGKNYLIAVYDDNAVETAEYYNANGQLIARGVAPEYPSMAGYGKAKAWKQYGETNIFVAEYELEAAAKNIDVTVVNGSGTGTYAYGDTVECIASGEGTFKCWTKTGINGKTEIVSMDSSYKFKAWEKCTVAAVYGDYTYTGAKCKIIIDSFTAGDENVIMAEFIGFGTDVLEKGIMWNGNKIAMAKPGNQFTVIADKNGEYKGYAILGNATDGYTLITDDSLTVSDAK